MSAEREEITIDLFDRLCTKFGGDMVTVNNFRRSFKSKFFVYGNESR